MGPPRFPPHGSPRHQRPPARTLRVLRRYGASAAPASARDRRGRSAGMQCASPRNATSLLARRQPPRRRSARSPNRASLSVCAAPRRHTSRTPTPTMMRRVPPGRHILVARDPSASTGDESSQGSTDELPPATSHGYVEWDFSGVPDPVMFRRFLDATNYWFSYSDDSSAGSYDPARECCVVIASDPANAADAAGAGDGEVPPALGTRRRMAAGPSAPPPSPLRGPTSTHSLPKHASSRPSWRRNTARCSRFAPLWGEKPPRAASARVSWAD
jgi:hypothetical protein